METKRWAVTYTKHVNQKRKVYHDGLLELCGSTKKVMLYDDCDKLIYSKCLKKDEVIECGASLTFETHLVDIGEPEKNGKCQVVPDDEKLSERTGTLVAKNKRNILQIRSQQNYSNVICSSIKDNSKSTLQNRRLHKPTDAVPSGIKVSDKTGLSSSGVLQSRPDAIETTPKEWNALYTTQKTQKAKRYHDGILRLADCGSRMKQVILVNEDGAILSSKYLKPVEFLESGHTFEFPNYLVEIGDRRVSPGEDFRKGHPKQATNDLKNDEIKECGASLMFETHLVDIGKHEKNGKSKMVLDDKRLNERTETLGVKNKRNTLQVTSQQSYSNVICSSIEDSSKSTLETRRAHEHTDVKPSDIEVSNKTELGSSQVLHSRTHATETTPREWNALYTTQKTQKAKRYHDGILQLADCGSHMKQVILLNEDGAILSSKYLKPVECLETGHTFEFPNYLVEVGDRKVLPGDDVQKDTSLPISQSSRKSISNFTSVGKNYPRKPLPTEDLHKGHPKQATKYTSSNALKQSTSTRLINSKELRDASQILSILKKPLPGEILRQAKLPVEHTCPVHTSDIIDLDVQNANEIMELNAAGMKYASENHESGSQKLNVSDAAQTGISGGTCLNSQSIQPTQTATVSIDEDPDQEGESQEYEQFTLCNRLVSTSAAEMGVEYEGNKDMVVRIHAAESVSSKRISCTSPSQEIAVGMVFSGDVASRQPAPGTSRSLLTEEGLRCLSYGKQQIEDSSSSSVMENVNSSGSNSFSGIHDNDAANDNNVINENFDQVSVEKTEVEERCKHILSVQESYPTHEASATIYKDDSELEYLSKNCEKMDNFPSFDLGF